MKLEIAGLLSLIVNRVIAIKILHLKYDSKNTITSMD